MPRIRWSERASLDLIRLYEFLAPKSQDAAIRAVKTIRQGVKVLARQPEIGRTVDDLPAEFRELVIEFGQGTYVVRYQFDGVVVVLLALRHGKEAGW